MTSPRRIAVFADFDDTLTTENVAHFLLNRFAPDAMKDFSSRYRTGELTFREYQEMSFNAVEVSVNEMQSAAADRIAIRDGIEDLLEALDAAGGEFRLASAGLRFYIEPVLTRNGLDEIEVVCGSAEEAGEGCDRFTYTYPFADQPNEPCKGDWATCKCKALETAGDDAVKIFVGDGNTSDACVAERADYVFARDRLLNACAEKHIDAIPFEDFAPVTELVQRLSAGAAVHADSK